MLREDKEHGECHEKVLNIYLANLWTRIIIVGSVERILAQVVNRSLG